MNMSSTRSDVVRAVSSAAIAPHSSARAEGGPCTTKLGGLAAASAIVILTTAPSASAETVLTGRGCEGALALFAIPADQVLPVVSPTYQPAVMQDAAGHATVFVGTAACLSVTVEQRTTEQASYAVMGIAINPGDSTPGLHFYLLSWISDSLDYAAWLEDGTGLAGRVRYVPNIQYDLEPPAGGPGRWTIAAPPPSPDPFLMCADTTPPVDPGSKVIFWRDTEQGTVRIESHPVMETFGQATGTLTIVGDSELAQIFGSQRTRPFTVGLSFRLEEGSLSKQVLP